ncbi:hypothetical protein MYX82_09475 [Acidobacteria bacterium AH-259-D05]|nr:hypothetical protein [Acidobacteria bacterium AH-259-D05]
MNDFPFLILLYMTGILFVLGGYLFYLQFSSLHCNEFEIRFLERFELHLAHILRLLEAPDVKMLLKNPESRQRLFLEFSSDLRKDMVALWRSRKFDVTALLFVATFFLGYYAMRLKAYVRCGRNDLRFLSGLELALFRRLEKVELD